MAGPERVPGEFETIARLFRPLTEGSPEALDLLDDVAALAVRPGHDVVLTADAMVEGVHFLTAEPLDLVARKLLRVNLSDLAAKGASPHGYLLTIAWPHGTDFDAKARFAAGLAEDQAYFGVRLLGGDTVSTPGPLTAGLTMIGWSPTGQLVRRSGARAGDVVLVSGVIGDAGLGLSALMGGLEGVAATERESLVERHRLPTPRLALREALRRHATAAADVSDGLLADAGHIGAASGVGVRIALEKLPCSPAALAWLGGQPDEATARLTLATFGDDYELVCATRPQQVAAFVDAAHTVDVPLTVIGEVTSGPGLQVSFRGEELAPSRLGWTHEV